MTAEPVRMDKPVGVIPGVLSVTREDFLTRRWRYKAGEHVTILGPTGSGKTWFGLQLLDVTARPTLPAVVLVMKPRDGTVSRWARNAEFRRVKNWPPPPQWAFWRPKQPPGWLLWPRSRDDVDEEIQHHHEVFDRAILDAYKRGGRIIFGDETYSLSKELGLERQLNRVWTKGRSMGAGMWGMTQRPAHIPLNAYSQAEHMFIAYDPDKRARERYDEIGGVDPGMVRSIVEQLPRYHWLYIRRSDRVMCVIGP